MTILAHRTQPAGQKVEEMLEKRLARIVGDLVRIRGNSTVLANQKREDLKAEMAEIRAVLARRRT